MGNNTNYSIDTETAKKIQNYFLKLKYPIGHSVCFQKSRIGEAFLFVIKLQGKTAKQNAEIPIPTMLIKTRLLLLLCFHYRP